MLTVPLIGIAAFSLDIGWWQVGANQLQTTADAAALAGARALQVYRGQAGVGTTATSYATQTAAGNKAFAQTVSVTGGDVVPGFWDPDAKSFSPTGGWTGANAVEVTARATPNLIFAGVMRTSGPAIARKGVAWVANLTSVQCPKPFGFPFAQLQAMVGSANDPLTQSNLEVLENLTPLQRTVIVLPPGLGNSYVPPTPNNGLWAPMVFGGSSSANVYRDLVQGTNCANLYGELNESTQPSQGNNIPNFTTQNFANTGAQGCYGPSGSGNGNTSGGNGNPTGSTPGGNGNGGGNGGGNGNGGNGNGNGGGNGGTTNANCYASAALVGVGTVGVTVMTTWVAPTGGNGSNANTVKMIGEVTIMCYFSSTTDRCGNVGTWTPNIQNVAYPEGTIVAIVNRRSTHTLAAGEELGNTASTSQKLVLVR
ncbi:pilus assembly protein TadG-related protein [Roseisolibacter sp. H3M3-2]|uniref:pilus assembly protein TadG-related protein n=1 Tax=Roseisolibacter sp. H3M3-2 TaxID=3031323 RepID=UPI0031F30E4D